jgi:hypothetical protein
VVLKRTLSTSHLRAEKADLIPLQLFVRCGHQLRP